MWEYVEGILLPHVYDSHPLTSDESTYSTMAQMVFGGVRLTQVRHIIDEGLS